MRLSAIVPVLLFPAFGVAAGAEYDNRPEALLAAMGTAPAEIVIGNSFSVVEEKAPFMPFGRSAPAGA